MLDDEGWWAAPVQGKVVRIRYADSGFLWETIPGEPDFALVSDCFRLDDDIGSIYSHLASSDAHLAELIDKFRGLRILRQDPEECILSYVCSTANSVPRIMAGIEALSRKYGRLIAEVGGRKHYSFPTAEAFVEATPRDLYETAGLAWRGENIAKVSSQILNHPLGWLNTLRDLPYETAKSELLGLHLIGAKIADCVCLFALDKDQAVPVDTHIRQVACRYYMPDLACKTITSAAYGKIAAVFLDRFGQYAGWAQEFLFYEDLLRGRQRSQ